MLTRHPSKNKRVILLAEYKEYERLHLISIAAAILIAIGVGVTLFFLYTNIYQSISKTREVLLTDPALNVETIDFNEYDKVMAAWEKKINTETPATTRDPFVFVAKPNATSTKQ
ncbi:MAG: hypothetical protein HY569_02720 [Candidatus Magasanikbacteria bacterium]|nr:hypothetical protein [Candidatus Magasanikbacteria bacterium]